MDRIPGYEALLDGIDALTIKRRFRHSRVSDGRPNVGDIALVTQRSGRQYVGVYTLAPGIDYFWRAIVPGSDGNQLRDPDVSFEVVGRAFPPTVEEGKP